jgi:hypothetical protein
MVFVWLNSSSEEPFKLTVGAVVPKLLPWIISVEGVTLRFAMAEVITGGNCGSPRTGRANNTAHRNSMCGTLGRGKFKGLSLPRNGTTEDVR